MSFVTTVVPIGIQEIAPVNLLMKHDSSEGKRKISLPILLEFKEPIYYIKECKKPEDG
jgi:hypothetical protein